MLRLITRVMFHHVRPGLPNNVGVSIVTVSTADTASKTKELLKRCSSLAFNDIVCMQSDFFLKRHLHSVNSHFSILVTFVIGLTL